MSLAMFLSSAALGVSLVITAVKLIDCFVRTDPRALIHMATWLLFLAITASVPCLIVLLIYQQWAPAMMLGAGVLIVITLLNWRAILERLDFQLAGNSELVPREHGQPRRRAGAPGSHRPRRLSGACGGGRALASTPRAALPER